VGVHVTGERGVLRQQKQVAVLLGNEGGEEMRKLGAGWVLEQAGVLGIMQSTSLSFVARVDVGRSVRFATLAWSYAMTPVI